MYLWQIIFTGSTDKPIPDYAVAESELHIYATVFKPLGYSERQFYQRVIVKQVCPMTDVTFCW